MSSRSRSGSGPGSLAISTVSPSSRNVKNDATHGHELGEASESEAAVSETALTSMPDASMVNTSSPIVLSTSDINKAALLQAVHQVRNLVAGEDRDVGPSYISLSDLSMQQNASTGILLRAMESDESEPAETLGAIAPTSIPVSLTAIPRREPKITIHFIRHAHVSFTSSFL